MQGSLVFTAAAVLTSCSVFFVSSLVAKKVYPVKAGNLNEMDLEQYRKLSGHSKIHKLMTLIFIGAVSGLAIGGALMRGVSSSLQLSSAYFVSSTAGLCIVGAITGWMVHEYLINAYAVP